MPHWYSRQPQRRAQPLRSHWWAAPPARPSPDPATPLPHSHVPPQTSTPPATSTLVTTATVIPTPTTIPAPTLPPTPTTPPTNTPAPSPTPDNFTSTGSPQVFV